MSDDLSIPNPGYRGNRAGRYGTGPVRVRPSIDPDTRRLMMFAGGLGAVLVVLISASGLIGHHSTEVPVVTADTHPIRVKPENPGGMKIDGAENDVFSGGSDTGDSKLAPPAEDPDAKALRIAGESPAPVVQAPAQTAIAEAPPPPRPAIIAGVPADKPAVAASIPADKPAVIASTPIEKPAVVATAPAARPNPVPPAKPQVAAVETHSPASGHPAMVQLAALTTEQAAREEWQQLSKRMPGLLHGRQPVFSRTERDGHTFWRVRTAGFADTAQARSFCDHVREKGGGCSVADF